MAHTRFHVAASVAAIAGPGWAALPAWRLVGGNNRVLGRAPEGFVDFETGYAAVLFLRERIADALPVLGVAAETGGRTWRLEIDNVVVARSARTYLRGRENLYNLAHFLESVPLAELPAPARTRDERGRVCLA
ncbi:hypothetical protein ABIA31_001878 [Catenulispora sp. MAP5-51]|uniref:hypothetical protein n=1 Tax=Catenulispora sp. MAP5-51 TaxID=3156298 RepID=UPI003513FF10